MSAHKAPAYSKEFDRTLLQGLPTIARYVGKCLTTVRKWYTHHGFPIGKLPNGDWVSSTALIDEWIRSRDPRGYERRG